MRDVHCDFCNVVVTDHGWDCPTRDFDYAEPRTGIDSGEVVDGSIGSWLACDECAVCVRNGDRDELAARAVVSITWHLQAFGAAQAHAREVAATSIRELHDQFWANRTGELVRIDAAQVALIAADPATMREWRPKGA